MKNFFYSLAGILGIIGLIMLGLYALRNFNRRPSMVLTSDVCDAPCWYGIDPGQTSTIEALDLLSQMNEIDQYSLSEESDHNDTVTSYYWYFQMPAEDSAGSVYFTNDQVTAVSILTVDSLKLGEFFEKFGEPDEYWTEIGTGENREFLRVTLFYPTNGYVVNLIIDIEGDVKQVEIKESDQVFQVTFFEPALLQDLLKTRILIDKPLLARTGSFIPWTGVGTININNED